MTVDPADPAFGSPSKPIGPFFPAAQARQLAAARGWVVKPDSGRGHRRVVASPEPIGVVEIDALAWRGTRTGAPASNSARPARGAARTPDIGRC